MLALLGGASVYAFVAALSRMWIAWDVLSLMSNLAAGAFMGFLFACVAALVHVPIILIARRTFGRPRSLALVGAMVFPFPMFTLFLLGGGWRAAVGFSAAVNPAVFLVTVLPYVLGGAAIGWSLAARSEQQTPAIA